MRTLSQKIWRKTKQIVWKNKFGKSFMKRTERQNKVNKKVISLSSCLMLRNFQRDNKIQ